MDANPRAPAADPGPPKVRQCFDCERFFDERDEGSFYGPQNSPQYNCARCENEQWLRDGGEAKTRREGPIVAPPAAATAGEPSPYLEPWTCDDELVVRDAEEVAVASAESELLAERIVACVNACAGFADPERDLAELVAALRAVTKRLELFEHDYGPGYLPPVLPAAREVLALAAPGPKGGGA